MASGGWRRHSRLRTRRIGLLGTVDCISHIAYVIGTDVGRHLQRFTLSRLRCPSQGNAEHRQTFRDAAKPSASTSGLI